MNDKELWELMSIICEGQDSEQRRKVEQYITDLQKEIERLNNIINELEEWLEEDKDKAMITFETGRCFNYHDIINKIETLKGSDKE